MCQYHGALRRTAGIAEQLNTVASCGYDLTKPS